jgi:hypothetical protein
MRRTASTIWMTVAALVIGAFLAGVGAAPGVAKAAPRLPHLISLPDGFQPEGIAAGRRATFFVGSLADGAIYRGNFRTGTGGPTGAGRVYDARTGDLLRSYSFFAAPTEGFVNDVVVTRRAAYFTDSANQVLYVVPIGPRGRLFPAFELPITGALVFDPPPAFNANGIEASPNGRSLLVVQSSAGKLFRIHAATGVSREVRLRGGDVASGDGLLRIGRTLYVVQNQLDRIAVVRLGARYATGRVRTTITDRHFQVPTTVASFGRWLFAVNAKFGTTPTPGTPYEVVRVRRR